MILNLKENKKIINKFEFNNIFNIVYPLEDNTYKLVEGEQLYIKIKDDSCTICCETFNINDNIILWSDCNHPIHFNCYKLLINKYKMDSCPTCRSQLKKINYQERFKYLFSNDDYYDYCYEEKVKYNDVSPFYIDEKQNLNVRLIVFCNKYNLNIDESRYYSDKLNNVSVEKLLMIVSLLSLSKFSEINQIILSLLCKYVVIKNKVIALENYNTIINNLKLISEIFKINSLDFKNDSLKNNSLDLLVTSLINDATDLLIKSNKKDFINKIYNFITSIEGRVWFYLNDFDNRKKFYQKKLVKTLGETFRKVFNSENIESFIDEINILYKKNLTNKHNQMRLNIIKRD